MVDSPAGPPTADRAVTALDLSRIFRAGHDAVSRANGDTHRLLCAALIGMAAEAMDVYEERIQGRASPSYDPYEPAP